MIIDVFLNQKRVNVCGHMLKKSPHEFWISATRMGSRQEEVRNGGDGGKIGWKLSEVNTREMLSPSLKF